MVLNLNDHQLKCYELPKNPLREIVITFGTPNIEHITKQLIISGSSKSLIVDESFDFFGPSDSDIMYLRVYKNLNDSHVHQTLRDAVINEFSLLTNIKFSINRSFLPLTVKNAHSATITELDEKKLADLKGMKLRVPKYKASEKTAKNQNNLSYTDAFNEVMYSLEKKYGMQISYFDFDTTSFGDVTKRSSLYDMEMLLTGIIVEDPFEDIRFMFKSKEGIQLPDVDGTIEPLLNSVEENIQKINDKIWEQSRIIPLTHYSSGMWFKKDIFDVSNINHMLPPTNFQFIGFK